MPALPPLFEAPLIWVLAKFRPFSGLFFLGIGSSRREPSPMNTVPETNARWYFMPKTFEKIAWPELTDVLIFSCIFFFSGLHLNEYCFINVIFLLVAQYATNYIFLTSSLIRNFSKVGHKFVANTSFPRKLVNFSKTLFTSCNSELV